MVNLGISILAWTYRTRIMQKNMAGHAGFHACKHIGSIRQANRHLARFIMIMKIMITQKQKFQVSGWVTDTNRNQLKPKCQVVPIWVNQQPIGGEKSSDFEKNCDTFQKWHQKLSQPVQPNNHWKRLHYVLPVIVRFYWSPNFFMSLLKIVTSPIFFNIATFGIFRPF